ncbi:MAG: GNAT family N-acetyltransferase [Patulibacter sp.]
MTVPVRRATDDDLERAEAALRGAFSDYPWTRWTVPEDRHAERVGALQRLYLERLALPHGAVWVDEQVRAVAAFVPPDAPPLPDDALGQVLELHGDLLPRLESADALTSEHADPDAWSLATVGVDPAHQGQGLGGAVCRAGLDHLDEQRQACGLETSDPRNVRLYERLGFGVVARTEISEGGPTVWTMHRASR